MLNRTRTSHSRSKSPPNAKSLSRSRLQASSKRQAKSVDAVSLLKSDHRQVEELFAQFQSARSESRKRQLATSICDALTVHTSIEEEIFYPAFLEATDDKDIHHQAVVEHDGAKKLIAEIRGMSGDDDYFEAKVIVLSEMIKHHVKEEEQPGGMLSEAKKSDMDLAAIGEQLLARKGQLQSQAKAG